MSAEVVLNEVWTEDRSTLYPPPPPSPLCLIPPCKRQEEAHRVTKTHGVQQAGRGGREGNGGVNRRERLFFPLISPSIIMWSQPDPRSQPVNGTFKIFFFSWADVPVSAVSVFTCAGMCACSVPVRGACLCGAKQVKLDVLLAQERKKPAHSHS